MFRQLHCTNVRSTIGLSFLIVQSFYLFMYLFILPISRIVEVIGNTVVGKTREHGRVKNLIAVYVTLKRIVKTAFMRIK